MMAFIILHRLLKIATVSILNPPIRVLVAHATVVILLVRSSTSISSPFSSPSDGGAPLSRTFSPPFVSTYVPFAPSTFAATRFSSSTTRFFSPSPSSSLHRRWYGCKPANGFSRGVPLASTRSLEIWMDTTTTTSTTIDDDRLLALLSARAKDCSTIILKPISDDTSITSSIETTIDNFIRTIDSSSTTLLRRSNNNRLIRLGNVGGDVICGVVIHPSTPEGIDAGTAAMGSTEWIAALPLSCSISTDAITCSSSSSTPSESLLSSTHLSEWNMIPAENLIASARGTGTRIAFSLLRAGDAAGLEGALETGVDALCLPSDAEDEVWDAALIAKQEREARMLVGTDSTNHGRDNGRTAVEDKGIRIVTGRCWRTGGHNPNQPAPAVRADRICIDLVQTLSPTEGLFLGSSSKLLALVLSEAAISTLVPSRPFRVNAGPVHSYVLMGDGETTRYLCEIKAGDEVCVYNALDETVRGVVVGRLKREVRPCVMVGLCVPESVTSAGDGTNIQNNLMNTTSDRMVGQIFLQQAETVRLGQKDGGYVCVTDLPTCNGLLDEDSGPMAVLLRVTDSGTHIGKAYNGMVLES